MNDYERLTEDLDHAINAVETAYSNAYDEEDETALDDALTILRRAQYRARKKALDDEDPRALESDDPWVHDPDQRIYP